MIPLSVLHVKEGDATAYAEGQKKTENTIAGQNALASGAGWWYDRSTRETKEEMTMSATVSFKCPACGSVHLEETKEADNCPACGNVYTIVDGIYNFLIE